MSEDIKLFVSCHKPGTHIPENNLLEPIQVGSALSASRMPNMLHDDDGESISQKNRSYCELTGQYWAWKNTDADYYGFLHYRRYFNFSDTEYPIHHEPFIFGDVTFDRNDKETLQRIDFDEETMRRVITAHDFIAPEPIEAMEKTTVYEQYRDSFGHHIEDLDTVMDIIRLKYPDIWPSAQKYLNQTKVYVCNMFVMKRELFRTYSEFLFDVLATHEQLRDISHYTPVARRVSGYLGERICGMYLTYLYDKGYNGINLQRVYFRNTDEQQHAATTSNAPRNAEKLQLTPIVRGPGKIYAGLQAEGLKPNWKFKVSSISSDGKPLPAKIVPTGTKPVLVLPIVAHDQTTSVQATDDAHNNHVFADITINRRMAQLQSVANRFLHNDAGSIRNCDKQLLESDARVSADALINNLDGTEIIHGHVSIPLMHEGNPNDYVNIIALDGLGNHLSTEDWICMGEELSDDASLPGLRIRKVSFSLRIPRSDTFIIWVQFPDSDHQDAFLCSLPAQTQALRNLWARQTEPACAAGDYDKWFRSRQRATVGELMAQRHARFTIKPKYSIIVPLYKTPIPFLRAMANSVVKQTYPNWELLLVNASPEEQELSEVVDKLCAQDKRIQHITLQKNQGITLNTNEGIKLATGDFLCFLDHDDVLEPDALFCYTRAVNEHPDTDMLYCDEDKLDNGKYREPFFKTEWNPDLLLGMNYVCHFLTVRKSIMDTLDLPGKEYDGSQDWHMTFRIGEKARYVHHEPRVLYHWRVHSQSTAARADQKDYTLDSSRLSIETHLERCGIKGEVVDSPLMPRRFKVNYALGNHPMVSIIIPNKDAVSVLHNCLSSIRKLTTYDNYEVVIVENNSEDPFTFKYYEMAQQLDPHVRVVTLEGMESFNFSRIINFGASQAKGDYYLMLNNDTEVITPNWIEELLGPCMREDVGITGAKLLFPDNTIQHAGISFGPDGPGHLYYQEPRNYPGNFEATMLARDLGAVTGACLMVSKDAFDKVHGMTEELAVNYNDVDFCLKVLREKLLVVFIPTAELHHYESVSRGSDASGKKAIRFEKERGEFMSRWPEAFTVKAPFENPNMQFGILYQILNRNYKRANQ
ncbi:glycosyltransferase, group 2 family protein [Bifidobacterium saguini DSM 23967]|uniref:Glycosyltransferase, group 2 family protein n=2 Tax=Bifidobacterium saguini TaxID=762210 RepID=A0A087DEF2_9BIFI|nr:DUF4422 domain-containing protein [Bifidobacterium saguini]KFI93902.1 glycosyltransferase, group 2 family protein [Bifidobacterium saguini DSM 23967]QTB90063.1 DUF4422 domain-containing protein [Bifidobacterium saguini]